MCAFRRGPDFALFSTRALASLLEPAWATTVHKAQGTECDSAVLFLSSVSRHASRELIYTAVTRAREHVVIWSDPESFEAAIRAREERVTGLLELLQP